MDGNFVELTLDEAYLLEGGCWGCRAGGAIGGAATGGSIAGIPGAVVGGLVGLWIAW